MTVATQIQERLGRIEIEEGVRIVYACESGSRAWGFASADSDFDIRFIYVRRPDWYLSIDVESRRDVIELPIENNLDINGWDLRKALKLLRKSNPPLVEWLGSPMVYRDQFAVADKMRELVRRHLNETACAHHYLQMARGNYRDYLQGDVVWLKKYLYVLRPLMAVLWIERGYGVVPTEFERLYSRVIDDAAVLQAIDELLQRKRDSKELDQGPKIGPISDFIDREMSPRSRRTGNPARRAADRGVGCTVS
jgi:predicted nucleotidyltransferase